MMVHQRSGRVSPSPGHTPTPNSSSSGAPDQDVDGGSFEDHLTEAGSDADGIVLSVHARQRVAQRDISLDAAERQTLSNAMQTLDDKGAQDAAVLREDAAFLVNVPNRTVVTALDQSEMQQRVFTQIDSAMTLY
jgi:flagellar operon protein